MNKSNDSLPARRVWARCCALVSAPKPQTMAPPMPKPVEALQHRKQKLLEGRQVSASPDKMDPAAYCEAANTTTIPGFEMQHSTLELARSIEKMIGHPCPPRRGHPP